MNKSHAFIPDTQITVNTDIRHIIAAGRYLAAKKPDVIVIAGDWWDMNSLNSFDRPGCKDWELRDVKEDFDAGNSAMNEFIKALRSRKKGYRPEIHFTHGNHEHRVIRALEDPLSRQFKGWLDPKKFHLERYGILEHPFLEIAKIDGIMYTHYFNNPDSKMGNPIGGKIQNRIWKLGGSCTSGHEQVYMTGECFTATGTRRRGLVCGRFYQEDLDYLTPQKAKQSWSGILLKHEVHDGDYDLMEVSMNFLLRKWI